MTHVPKTNKQTNTKTWTYHGFFWVGGGGGVVSVPGKLKNVCSVHTQFWYNCHQDLFQTQFSKISYFQASLPLSAWHKLFMDTVVAFRE